MSILSSFIICSICSFVWVFSLLKIELLNFHHNDNLTARLASLNVAIISSSSIYLKEESVTTVLHIKYLSNYC